MAYNKEADARYYKKNREKVLARKKKARDEHPERAKVWYERKKKKFQQDPSYHRESLKREYENRKKRKLSRAGRPIPDACELCGRITENIVYDHNHKTGKFRGWLCYGCNNALGAVQDSVPMLMRMIEYVEKHR
jgi:hypothetical protein